MSRVVLVTGVSRYFGGRFANLVQQQPGIKRVIGVDTERPASAMGDAEFVRADMTGPVVAELLQAADVDTVVHLNVIATPGGDATGTVKEVNVIGSMQLLAACQAAPSVKRFIVKSSSSVYGVSPKDPAKFTEDMDPRRLPRAGFGKDSIEVEAYIRGFGRRRPDVAISMLRFANVMGPQIDTPLTRYFALPVIPTVLGYDARLQFTHEDDALSALLHCTMGDVAGTFNVAGDGVLMLAQAIARSGRVNAPVPSPFAAVVREAGRRLGLVDFSAEQVEFLKYGRALDTGRMRTHLKFEPAYTTVDAFDAFVDAHRVAREVPLEALDLVTARLPLGRPRSDVFGE